MNTPQATGEQLRALQIDIAQAEQTLQRLRRSISEVRSDGGMADLCKLRAENERLIAQSHLDADERDSAHAALDEAIKVSETDQLTGLPNRLVLWGRLAHDIAMARRHSSFLAVYFLDLDGFKALNDQFGRAAGDRLLQVVATRLTQTLRASDTVCRIGGDEFMVVVQGNQASDLQGVGRKILDALGAPFSFGGHVHAASASMGWSSFPHDGDTPEALVRHADAAMYRDKRLKKRDPAPALTVAAQAGAPTGASDPDSKQPGGAGMAPGDEAPTGTPGTGEKPCPACGGSGRDATGGDCANCAASGKVTAGIGGG